jgi:xanthine dehydrogenase accessory factor
MEDVLAALTDALARGEAVAMVTIVAAHGSTPQRVGARMLVFSDGRIVGTIGGGCYENDAVLESARGAGARPIAPGALRTVR